MKKIERLIAEWRNTETAKIDSAGDVWVGEPQPHWLSSSDLADLVKWLRGRGERVPHALALRINISKAATTLGRKGGSARSERKTAAAKANRAKGGGWPKGRPRGRDKIN